MSDNSREYMHRLTSQRDQAWTQTELDAECQRKYGSGWVYDSGLKICVKGGERMGEETDKTVSHADRKGTRSLRGNMIHRSAKTARGKAVVPDKADKKEQ